MDKLWNVIYQVLLIMLQEKGSFIKKPKKIDIFVDDGVRRSVFSKEFEL